MTTNNVLFNYSGQPHEVVYANGSFYNEGKGLQLNWGVENFGFGECAISCDKESGKLLVHSEYMSKEFVTKVLEKLIQNSIFTDFETLTKQIKDVSLEEANSLISFDPNILYSPFFIESDSQNSELIQRRWHIANESVLNIWFNKEIIKEFEDPFSLDMFFTDQQSFAFGFIKAEVWSWTKILKS